MPTPRSELRALVETMMQRGEIASAAEAAWIAGVPRQTAARWAREAEIDIEATRLRWLARQRRRLLMVAEGKMPRRPTKAEMRRQIAAAMRRTERATELEKQRPADSRRQTPTE